MVFQGTLDLIILILFNLKQGTCAEHTAKNHSLTRQQQDDYAVRSYTLSQKAAADGIFKKEIVPVEIPQRKGY